MIVIWTTDALSSPTDSSSGFLTPVPPVEQHVVAAPDQVYAVAVNEVVEGRS